MIQTLSTVQNISAYYLGLQQTQTNQTQVKIPVKLWDECDARCLLLCGFIRQRIQNQLRYKNVYHKECSIFYNIPQELMTMIGVYHGKISVGFSIFNDAYSNLQNHVIQASECNDYQRVIASNIGYDKGKISWKIRCKSSYQQLIVGVIGNLSEKEIRSIQESRPWFYEQQFAICYYWDDLYGSSIAPKRKRHKKILDIIVTLNCDCNTLMIETKPIQDGIDGNSYNIKSKSNTSCTINIKENTTYYPCMGFFYGDEKYQIIYCNDMNCWECYKISRPEQ